MQLSEHYAHEIICGQETIDGEVVAYYLNCLDCDTDLLIQTPTGKEITQ